MQNIYKSKLMSRYESSGTFIGLYKFLQMFNGDIAEWLNVPWKGKDKQESILRLFAGLGFLPKLHNYDICTGNFNLYTIKPMINKKEIFWDKNNNPIHLKDNGDSSDLTGFSKLDKYNIY